MTRWLRRPYDAALGTIELVAVLYLATVPLAEWAGRSNVPYPIALVVGGAVLGFVPGLPHLEMPAEVVLLVFLPPLLYWESITAPAVEMRRRWVSIAGMSLGLVVLTTVLVAMVAHALVPGLAWPLAFVLGSILGPTDDVAFVAIAERFAVPRHTIATIEGESLLNDASALVLYAVALGAVATGTFSPGAALVQLVLSIAGALGIGLAVGFALRVAWTHVRDPRLQISLSLLAPFLAFLPAQQVGVSGVLAVVTTGLYVNRWTPKVLGVAARRARVPRAYASACRAVGPEPPPRRYVRHA